MGLCLDTEKTQHIQEYPLKDNKLINKDDDYKNVQVRQIEFDKQNMSKINLQDFDFIKVLGRGSFGKVMLVQYKKTNQLYAMKIVRKDLVKQRNQQLHMKSEREILEQVQNPFIVQLHFAFQSQIKLYLITDFMIGGRGNFFLNFRSYKFNEDRAKLYAAEIVLGLEYLHSKGIVYRDLKPENILLGADGHIKLTDFGLAKIIPVGDEKTHTFCGTPEYLAPEILLAIGHNQCADWWSFGALLYEMLAGAPPFYSRDKNLMFKSRLEKSIEIKPWFSNYATEILKGLLQNNPDQRLGRNGSSEIKNHPFFDVIDWDLIYQKQIDPPFKPKLQDQQDLRHFDTTFTEEPVVDTPLLQFEIQKDDNYDKFTYMRGLNSSQQSMPRESGQKIQFEEYAEVNQNFKLIKKHNN